MRARAVLLLLCPLYNPVGVVLLSFFFVCGLIVLKTIINPYYHSCVFMTDIYLTLITYSTLYRTCEYNRLTEDEPLDSETCTRHQKIKN